MWSPMMNLKNVFAYEDAKISGKVKGTKYKNLIENAKKDLEPFVNGKINKERETLEFLDLARSEYFMLKSVGDFNSYEDRLNYYFDKEKTELCDAVPKDLKNFFVSNFGFDFTDHVFESLVPESPKTRLEQGSITYGHLVNHLSGIKTLYKKPFVNSKSIRLEIIPNEGMNEKTDLSHSDMIGWICGFLNIKPYYIERSVQWYDSAVLYFELSKYMSDDKKRRLENYCLSKFKIKINIQKSDEYCFLPFSVDYRIKGTYDIKNRFKVNQESFLEISNRLRHKHVNSVSKIEELIGVLDSGAVIHKAYRPSKDSNGSGQLIKNRAAITKSERALDTYQYGNGTRFNVQPKLSMWCASQSYDFNTFKDLAYLCNTGDSKDMKKWSSSKIDNVLHKTFENSLSNVVIKPFGEQFNVDNNNRFRNKKYTIKDNSAATWLDEEGAEKKLRDYLEIRFNEVCKTRRQKMWIAKKVDASVSLCRFILSKKVYDSCSGFVYEKEFEILNSGTLISKSMFRDLAKHLNIKSDIRKIFNYLIDFGILDKVYVNGYSHSYKDKVFATHYTILNSLKDFSKLVKDYFNKYNKINFNIKYNYLINNILNRKETTKAVLLSSINYMVNVGISKISENIISREKPPKLVI